MMMHRHSDRTKIVRSLFGAGIVLAAVAFRLFGKPGADWLIIGLVLIGAGLVSPSFVIDLVKAWRKPGEDPPK